ncbi:MAG: Uncharacterized protein G01um1014106_124 [Parcubacteria group bacterium Gr01-1014_106]|nr:MAG: Uncharacterized protein G01um1014106_124 [Parcubacteria group bacterium Gr01-1014_106]
MNRSAGFTLVEFLVYLGIVSVSLTLVTTLASALVQTEARGGVRETVDASASRVLTQIAESMRAATAINTADSIFGVSPGRLSLTMRDPLRSPTLFTVSAGRVEVSEGGGAPTPLTAETVDVTGFHLTRLNPANAKEGIQITLTADFRTSGTDPQFQFSHTYVTGVVLH